MTKRNVTNKDRPNRDILKEEDLTYDDYAAIDDGNYYELVRGKLELMSPSPSVTHQFVSFEMHKRITNSCETDYVVLYAPIDVILSPTEVRQPDLILIRRDRMHILRKRGVVGPPDLVVEILSPSSLKRDKIDKLHTYAEFQIPEYWIVEPELGILEQYILQEGRLELVDIFQQDDLVASPHIPCISFTMKEVVENIPEIRE